MEGGQRTGRTMDNGGIMDWRDNRRKDNGIGTIESKDNEGRRGL